MKKTQQEIPAGLIDFVREHCAGGGYEERFRKVLDEAFFTHQIFLNATNLKQIVGGGSLGTAQDAVTAFRARLHARVNHSVDLGNNLPQEVATKFSDALGDFWAATRAHSSKEWDEQRATMVARIAEAEDAARASDDRARASVAEAETRKGENETLRADVTRLHGEKTTLAASLHDSETRLEGVRVQLAASIAAEQKAQATLLEQIDRAERSAALLADKVKTERHDLVREHMLQLDGVRTTAKAEVTAVNEKLDKVRAEVTRLTAALAVAESATAAATESARAATASQRFAEAELRTSETTVTQLNGQVSLLTAQLEASAGRAVDTLALVSWIHGLDPLKASEAAPPWDETSHEARLATAILRILQEQHAAFAPPAPADATPLTGARP